MGWFWGSKKHEEAPVQQSSKKKICCACPETKRERDNCVAQYGPESERCQKLIEAHKQCLRAEGFKGAREVLGTVVMTMQQRRSAKALADPAQWRSRVRSECLQRVKEQRAGLLWRLRQGVEGGNAEANVKLVLADIIADVSCADAAAPAAPAARESDAAAPGDALMDEDFPEPAREQGGCAPKMPRPLRNIVDEAFELAPGEYEELMRSMEESLFEDMRRDEAAYLAEQEQWEAAAAEAEVSMLVDLHADEASTSGRTPCPICCEGHLTQHNGVVLCSRGDLRMDLRIEGLTLEDVRHRLANVLDAHGQQNCHGQPRFVLDTALMSNAPSLLMTCDTCGALHVVI